MENSLLPQLESLLFYKAEPIDIKTAARLLGASEESVREAVPLLSENLHGRGVSLVQSGDEIALATAPQSAELIMKIAEDEQSQPLSKAALETLAIILYQGPISQAAIDRIRGVSSHYILRSLATRGLIEKKTKNGEEGRYVYESSFKLLTYLGITNIQELPEYDAVQKEFQAKQEHDGEQPEEDELNEAE